MKRSLSLLLLMLAISVSKATHIVGGEIMYRNDGPGKDGTKYHITMLLFVDCKNAGANVIDQDKTGYIQVYRQDNPGDYTWVSSHQLVNAREGPYHVSAVKYNCLLNQPDVCVDKYIYQLDLQLPDVPYGYVLGFERCCRNVSINNIVNPSATGVTYWTSIPGYNLVNQPDNSPIFSSQPPTFICLNAPFSFDHSATDADGDKLEYELYMPYTSGSATSKGTNPSKYQNIRWESGYSTYMQIDGSPTLTIDRYTGKITLTPTRVGQFVIGVKVNEYRDGIKIGETRRDFQFNVIQCKLSVVSNFNDPGPACTETTIKFKNLSQGATSYRWDFGVPSIKDDTSTTWSPSYSYKNSGKYSVRLIAANDQCTDTFISEMKITQNFTISLPKDTIVCGPFSMVLSPGASGNKSYTWSTGESTPTINVEKGGQYWVVVKDFPCVSTDTMNISNTPVKADLGPDSVICSDSFAPFTFIPNPSFEKYTWNDHIESTNIGIDSMGTYILEVVDKFNCVSRDTIKFKPYPPPQVDIRDTQFCEGDQMLLDAHNHDHSTAPDTRYLWNSGSTNSTIYVESPGIYTVMVKNKLCARFDTARVKIASVGLDLGPDTAYCGNFERWFHLKKDYISYEWDDRSSSADRLVTEPGIAKVKIETKDGCIALDSVMLTQYLLPVFGLGNDTIICISSDLKISGPEDMAAYLWNNGSASRTVPVRDSGIYSLAVTDLHGCIYIDSIRFSKRSDALPVDMFIPNSFTPNGDNLNEVFPGNAYNSGGSLYDFRIYNSWGQMIFKASEPAQQWDGTFKGQPAEEDVYVYLVKYIGCDGQVRIFRGTFTLLR